MLLTYTIDDKHIIELAAEELSHVADKLYNDQGASLYDAIILTSKDNDIATRFLYDAINSFAARTFDICYRTSDGFNFYVPDLDVTMQPLIEEEITRYLSLYVAASFLSLRGVPDAKEYTERTQASANKAVTLLKSRKLPQE